MTGAEQPRDRVFALAVLVSVQGALMVGYALATLVIAWTEAEANWGAVGFVLMNLLLWGVGLQWVAWRGLVRHRRWAFSPVLFTQLVFGVIAVEDLRSTGNPPLAVGAWAAVLVLAVAALVMLFSAPVRTALVPPPDQPRGESPG